MSAPIRQAALPTARAVAWTPLITLTGGLIAIAVLFRAWGTTSGTVVGMGAGALAAAVVFSLRDPAAALLAPLPVSRLTRRLLRLTGVSLVALPVWLLVTLTLPGDGAGLAPLLALTSTGVAAATWLPADSDVALAAGVPLLWASTAELLGAVPGVAGDAADLWRIHPWPVAAAGLALVALGRHR